MLKSWEELPDFMRIPEVRPYWEIMNRRRGQLVIKRVFDVLVSVSMLVFLLPVMAVIAVMIKRDSPGPVFYRQERITAYGRHFRIHKFRTMVNNADKLGTSVTIENDCRITQIGSRIREYRLDELPQVIDVIKGDMSIVGTRPEVVKYVERYKPEYFATLLLPAGITSEATIRFKNEDTLLKNTDNVDGVYLEEVLPIKMKWNLDSLRHFSFSREIRTMLRTFFAVLGKNYK